MKRIVYLSVLCGLVLCLACLAFLFINKNELNTEELSDEFMEEYFDSYAKMMSDGEQENILIVMSHNYPKDYGAKKVVEGPNHTYYMMYDTAKERDKAYAELAEDDAVSVEKNEKMELASYRSWGVEAMGIDDGIIARGDGGQDVRVAIIDTGLDVVAFRWAFPFKALSVYNVETNSENLAEMEDTLAHGTHIAGVIAEATTDRTNLMVIKADKNEELYVSDVNTAIYKAIDANADVINMSFGNDEYSESLKTALDAASAAKIVAVAAAGNDNSSAMFYPASYDNTISVAALDENLERAVWDEEKGSGSNYNEKVDYAAPGTNIRSINGRANGTSAAAPHVTAVVSLLKSYNKDLGLNEVNELLQGHVRDLGEEGKDDYYGYGMIDFNDAEFCDENFCDEYGVFKSALSAEDMTGGIAEVKVLEGGLMVTADEACTILYTDDDGVTYNRVPAVKMDGKENIYKFNFTISEDTSVVVALKGDGNFDGEISTADSNLINRSLVSTSLLPYRAMSDLERLVFDINGDNDISTADSNLINRSLISSSLLPYREIGW